MNWGNKCRKKSTQHKNLLLMLITILYKVKIYICIFASEIIVEMELTEKDLGKKIIDALDERGSTRVWLAKQFGFTTQTLYNKLENDKYWTKAELLMLKEILGVEK